MANKKNIFSNIFSREKKQESRRLAAASLEQSSPLPDPQQHKNTEIYQPGDIIGYEYKILRRIGKGGCGVVYLAHTLDTGEMVALKTFRDEYLTNVKARKAFKREAMLWVDLEEHPFILAARYVTEFSGRLFVRMDYVASDLHGRVNLEDHLIQSKGQLESHLMTKWAIQFCYGMEHANQRGIKIHRDIKPANILIAPDEIVKIADFGLAIGAQVAWREQGSILVNKSKRGRFGFSLLESEGRRICGTPGYIPPEIYREEAADVRSDIYSFGLVLWQMASGSPIPPFAKLYAGDVERYLKAIYQKQIYGQVPPVDSPLQAIIARCVAPERSERYESFRQLRGNLESILQQLTGKTVHIPVVDKRISVNWNDKGASLLALEQYKEAIDCFEKVLEVDPKNEAALTNMSYGLHFLGRYEEAIRCCDKALEIDVSLIQAWVNKGNILRTLGKYEEAILCHEEAIEINPNISMPWHNKGNALKDIGRYEEAMQCFDRALDIDQKDVNSLRNKGSCLNVLGKHQDSIRYFDKALSINPLDKFAWHDKGKALYNIGRHEEGLDCYERALEIAPDNVWIWYDKGLAEDELGRHQDAIKSYQVFLKQVPTQSNQYVAYARKRLHELLNID